jgi:hypothetical protein
MQLPGDGGDVSFISKGDVAAAIAGAVLIESGSCVFNLLLGSTQPRPCSAFVQMYPTFVQSLSHLVVGYPEYSL